MNNYLESFKNILTYFYSSDISAMDAVFQEYKNNDTFENAFMDYFREKETPFKAAWNRYNADFSIVDKQCQLLKHLKFDHQFDIMKNHCFESQIEHMRLLVKDEHAHTIMDTQFFAQCIEYHFHNEEFTIVDELNTLFKINVLAYRSHHGCFHGKYTVNEQEILFPTKFTLSEALYAPHYSIIFNYSDAKAVYLTSQNIALPTIEAAQNIIAAIENALKKENTHDSHTKKIFTEALNYYSKAQLYNDMQQSLPIVQSKVMRNKI